MWSLKKLKATALFQTLSWESTLRRHFWTHEKRVVCSCCVTMWTPCAAARPRPSSLSQNTSLKSFSTQPRRSSTPSDEPSRHSSEMALNACTMAETYASIYILTHLQKGRCFFHMVMLTSIFPFPLGFWMYVWLRVFVCLVNVCHLSLIKPLCSFVHMTVEFVIKL